MQLLVSVSSAAEARLAAAGGADIIDAKDPASGPLGPVALPVLCDIRAVVPAGALLSAALGDAADDLRIERDARLYGDAGAVLVKVGFSGISSIDRVCALLSAAVRGARAGSACRGVMAVAYADAATVTAVDPWTVVDLAVRNGVHGVLLDTADKEGPGVRDIFDDAALSRWVQCVRRSGLLAAVAGKLTAEDLERVHASGADVAGVRGAACTGGRNGSIDAARVRNLRARCGTRQHARSAV